MYDATVYGEQGLQTDHRVIIEEIKVNEEVMGVSQVARLQWKFYQGPRFH
jgi:hypothetical protein